MRKFLVAALAACCFSQTAWATFDLQIVQLFPGGPDDEHLTADWFEVENVGDMPWDSTVDGTLWYDDSSSDVTEAVQLIGVDFIPAGGKAVFLEISDQNLPSDPDYNPNDPVFDPLTEFMAAWEPPILGTHEGSGLGGGGDAVTLYTAPLTATTVDDLVEVDKESYPDTVSLPGDAAFDVGSQSFHVAGQNGAVLQVIGNRSAIAALDPVPEPSTLLLCGMGMLGLAQRRRR